MRSFAKYGLNAGVAMGLAAAWFGPSTKVSFIVGQQIPIWLGVGISVAAASYASDLLHEYLYPEIIASRKLEGGASKVTGLAMTAGSSAMVGMLLAPDVKKGGALLDLALIGMGAEVITDYFWSDWLSAV